MSWQQRTVQANGVDLNIVDAGQGDPALIFLHYWGGSSRTWAPVIERLCAAQRCIAVDFRGWGESGKNPTDYRLETLAEDILALLENLRLTRFVLVGHSMGGKVAQIVATRRPAGLTQLVLIAPAPPTALAVPADKQQSYIDNYSSPKGVERALDLLSPPDGADHYRQRLLAYRQQIIEDTLTGSIGAKRAWPEQGMGEDIAAAVATIAVPVHIIVGSADTVEQEASLRNAFNSVLPATTFTVLPGVGHVASLEAPAEVADAIRSALI